MKWRSGRRSQNVEDRRNQRAGTGSGFPFPGGFGGRGGGRIPKGKTGGLGLIVIVLLALFFGFNPLSFFEGESPNDVQFTPTQTETAQNPAANDEMGDFMSVILADTEDTWKKIFKEAGHTYVEPKLVLFSGQVGSACGYAQAAVGPFYCPRDRKIYLDMSFFNELKHRFGAPGDFAQAYVLAHEAAHHVQNLLGILPKVEKARAQMSKREGNALTVRLELQADCLSGIWAHHAHNQRQILEHGDIEEGLNAAAAIGDDRIQRQAQGYVVPDAFTHGSSEQRVRWFRQGLQSGDINTCDTFNAEGL